MILHLLKYKMVNEYLQVLTFLLTIHPNRRRFSFRLEGGGQEPLRLSLVYLRVRQHCMVLINLTS